MTAGGSSRPDGIDALVPFGYNVTLCPECLPPMSSLDLAEQRYLFGIEETGFAKVMPWGPVLPGVTLPCLAMRQGSNQCEREQGHPGYHTGGARWAHLYEGCDGD